MENNGDFWWMLLALVTPTIVFAIAGLTAYGKYKEWKGGVNEWKGAVNDDRESFKEFMTEIREDMKKIFDRLPPPTTSASSPLGLTEFGEKISTELELKKWAQKTASEIYSKVTADAEYEIYDFCVAYVKNDFEPSEEEEKRIREVAHNHAIEREKVLDVFVIELRDRILTLRDSISA